MRRRRKSARLSLEPLEIRLVPSWAGVPPTYIGTASAIPVGLDGTGSATGQAAITANEVDTYSFVTARTGVYTISAKTPNSDLDPVLGIFTASGGVLLYNDDISANDTDSQLSITLYAGQRYLIGITNFIGTSGGDYTWTIAGPGGATDDSYENNNSMAQAANLGTYTARREIDNLALLDGNDWYRFTMNGPGRANDYVSIYFLDSRGDLDLALYNANGGLVGSSNGTTDYEHISLSGVAAGTYYVRVYSYQNQNQPNYSLDISPGIGAPVDNHFLYLNFDGIDITRPMLTRWAGNDWASQLDAFDSDQNGIVVHQLLGNRSDREQIITRIMALVQQDVSPFGIQVRRAWGGAIENQGTTTIFLGANTLTNGNVNVACKIDVGNTDKTDIAFVGEEDWGSAERTALALADDTIHEAGHTWGLWHVQSGTAPETMGWRYSVTDQSQWPTNTGYTDRTYPPTADSAAFGPQNSFRTLLATFVNGNPPLPNGGSSTGGNIHNLPCTCPLCRGGLTTPSSHATDSGVVALLEELDRRRARRV